MTARTSCSGDVPSEQAVNSASETQKQGERDGGRHCMIRWPLCLNFPEGHGQIRAARLSYKTKHFWPSISRFVAGENRDHESHRTARRGRRCAALVLFDEPVGGRRRRSVGDEERAGWL